MQVTGCYPLWETETYPAKETGNNLVYEILTGIKFEVFLKKIVLSKETG